MQKILGFSVLFASLFICGAAFAQMQSDPSEDTPKSDAPKTTQSQSGEKTGEEGDGEIDLDEFFKKGEENAQSGASCEKPAAPASSIA